MRGPEAAHATDKHPNNLPYHDYQSVAGFDHPYGDYTETVTDGSGNFFSIWAEGESKLGSGDVYYAKY
jgi:hypothetical protein